MIRGVRQAGAALQKQERAARTLQNRYRRLTATTRSFVQAQLSLGSIAFIAGGGAGLASVVTTISAYEQALSTAGAISSATAAEFVLLREESRRLGQTTRFSAAQAAEGMVFIARAGFDVSAVLQTVQGTLLLAQAGALDLAAAADIATNILTGFRLETQQLGEVVDILALAANRSNTNVLQLGEAMKFVSPVSAGLGVSIQDTTAAVAALSNAGLQASIAGTGLRRVMAGLESPSFKAAQIFNSLGLSTDDVRVSTVGLIEVLRRLSVAGLDTGQALEAFGDRGGPAFEVLSSSIPFIEQMVLELSNAEGTALRVAVAMDDNLNGALLRVRSAYESVVLAFGEVGTTNVLRAAFDGLAEALRFVARNMEVATRVGTAFLLAFSLPRIQSLAVGMFGLASATGTFTVALSAAAVAARFLLRALLIGLAIELIVGAIRTFREFQSIVQETPALFEDAVAVGVDRFVNGFIQGLHLLGRLIHNLVPLFISPFIAAFVALGANLPALIFDPDVDFSTYAARAATAAAESFAGAFSDLIRDFSEDFGQISGPPPRFIEIASQEQIDRVRAAQEAAATVIEQSAVRIASSQQQVRVAVEESSRALLSQESVLQAIARGTNQYKAFVDSLTLSQRELRIEAEQQLQIDLAPQFESAGLEAQFGILNNFRQEVESINADLLGVQQRLASSAGLSESDVVTLRQQEIALRTQLDLLSQQEGEFQRAARAAGVFAERQAELSDAVGLYVKLSQDLITPLEKYQMGLGQLELLLSKGTISQEQFNKTVAQLAKITNTVDAVIGSHLQTVLRFVAAYARAGVASERFFQNVIRSQEDIRRQSEQDVEIALAPAPQAAGLVAYFAVLDQQRDRLKQLNNQLELVQRQLQSPGIYGLSPENIRQLKEQEIVLGTQVDVLRQNADLFRDVAAAARKYAESQAELSEGVDLYQRLLRMSKTPQDEYRRGVRLLQIVFDATLLTQKQFIALSNQLAVSLDIIIDPLKRVQQAFQGFSEGRNNYADFILDITEAQKQLRRDSEQEIQLALAAPAEAAGLKAYLLLFNDIDDRISKAQREFADIGRQLESPTLSNEAEGALLGQKIALTTLVSLLRTYKAGLEETASENRNLVTETTRTVLALQQYDSLVQQSITPLDRYQSGLANLTSLLDMGTISQEQFNVAHRQLRIETEQVSNALELTQAAFSGQFSGQSAFAEFIAETSSGLRDLRRESEQEIQIAFTPSDSARAGLEAQSEVMNRFRRELAGLNEDLIGIQSQLSRPGLLATDLTQLKEQEVALITHIDLLLRSEEGFQQLSSVTREYVEEQTRLMEAAELYLELLEPTLTITEQYALDLELLQLALDNARISQEQFNMALEQLQARRTQQNVDLLQTSLGQISNVARTAGDAIGGSFGKAAEKIGEVIDLVNSLLDLVSGLGDLFKALGGLGGNSAGGFSGFFSSLGFAAEGGPIQAGKPYMVGERGPELVIPTQSGTVIPNDQLTSFVTQQVRRVVRMTEDYSVGVGPSLNELISSIQKTTTIFDNLAARVSSIRVPTQWFEMTTPMIPQPRQRGGPVHPGQPYVVGEAGRELFVPGQAGSVFSNQALANLQEASGATTINNYYEINGGDELSVERGLLNTIPALEESNRRTLNRDMRRASSFNTSVRRGNRR